MPITAEGIEDKETENELRIIGCAKGQGWYYGRPLTILETRKILAERKLLPAGKRPELTAAPADADSPAIDQNVLQKIA